MPETYESLRPLMFSIAYRMPGSVSDARDRHRDGLVRAIRSVIINPDKLRHLGVARTVTGPTR